MVDAELMKIVHPRVTQRPRTPIDNPHYEPAWRYQTVHDYMVEAKKADTERRPYDLPRTENDRLVIEYFMTLRFGSNRRAQQMVAAHQMEFVNWKFGDASALKAQLIAGQSIEQIAERSTDSLETCQLYADLFFDVQPWMHKRNFKRRLVFNTMLQSVEDIRKTEHGREKILMGMAYMRGWEGLEPVLYPDTEITDAMRIQMEQHIHSKLTMESRNLVDLMSLEPGPRPNHFEKYLAFLTMQAQSKALEQQGHSAVAATDFLRAMHGKIMEHPEDMSPGFRETMELGVPKKAIQDKPRMLRRHQEISDKKAVLSARDSLIYGSIFH